MTSKIKIILVLSAILCFEACFMQARKPEWLAGQSTRYPEDSFVIGVGVGNTLDIARSNARAEISKVFYAKVTQNTSDSEKEESDNASLDVHYIRTETQTTVFTQELLRGVAIAETWFNNEIYYALAVLDKKKLSRELAEEIAQEEEIIEAQLTRVKMSSLPSKKIKAYSTALAAFDKKEELRAKKRIIDPALSPGTLAVSRAGLMENRSQEIKKIHFIIADMDGAGREITDAIAQSVTRLGFAVAEEMDGAKEKGFENASIRVTFTGVPLARGGGSWEFYSWKSTLQMIESSRSGTVLVSGTVQGQESGITDAMAKEKALLTAKKLIGQEIEKMIKQYMFNE